jgi:hypothetical protein
MSKTYAIADLHGRFDLLEMALARITERAELPAVLITLGDYVDRGPGSRQIIERLMAGLGRDGWRLICLKGNHEDIMWQTCRRLPDVADRSSRSQWRADCEDTVEQALRGHANHAQRCLLLRAKRTLIGRCEIFGRRLNRHASGIQDRDRLALLKISQQCAASSCSSEVLESMPA